MHLLSLVGLNSAGTYSFGVLISNSKSTTDHVTTDSRTAKSPIIERTYEAAHNVTDS